VPLLHHLKYTDAIAETVSTDHSPLDLPMQQTDAEEMTHFLQTFRFAGGEATNLLPYLPYKQEKVKQTKKT
jgi:hypothetical protein